MCQQEYRKLVIVFIVYLDYDYLSFILKLFIINWYDFKIILVWYVKKIFKINL
jgi:hypothetical protein